MRNEAHEVCPILKRPHARERIMNMFESDRCLLENRHDEEACLACAEWNGQVINLTP